VSIFVAFLPAGDVEHLFFPNQTWSTSSHGTRITSSVRKRKKTSRCTARGRGHGGTARCSAARLRLLRGWFASPFPKTPTFFSLTTSLLPFSCGPHAAAGRQSHPGGPACVRTSPAGQSHGSHSHPAHAPRGVLLSSSSTIPHGKCACGAAGSVRARSRWPSPSPY
jgi:hypothetical protein